MIDLYQGPSVFHVFFIEKFHEKDAYKNPQPLNPSAINLQES